MARYKTHQKKVPIAAKSSQTAAISKSPPATNLPGPAGHFERPKSVEVSSKPESSIQSFRGQGRPLNRKERSYFEPRFGVSFAGVEIHNSSGANTLARAVNARAFTVGNSIFFGSGQYTPQTVKGKKLLAHELAHTIQQKENASIASKPFIQRRRCGSSDAADEIIASHTVRPAQIQSPGDSVTFSVNFSCDVRGFKSDLIDSTGRSIEMGVYPLASSFPRSAFTRNWDGKRTYNRVGTYMVDDGAYRHQISEVKYAYRYNRTTGTSDDLYATGEALLSPEVNVRTRRGAFSNYSSNHYSNANVETLARIIQSEMGIGNEDEKRAIAWAVRNQMVRLDTYDASVAQNHFQDAHNEAATDTARQIAQEVLSVDMTNDTSGGAIKWFSPRSMPSEGESCRGYDCSGGLITVSDPTGTRVRKYAPGFHRTMTYVPVGREWYVRFYRL